MEASKDLAPAIEGITDDDGATALTESYVVCGALIC